MNVKLVSITQSLIADKPLSPEELIVYCARVSNPENQLNTDTAEKLIRFLLKKKHWSPFEMVDMTVEVKTSRAIAAQLLRHKSMNFQEWSQRYSEVSEFEPISIRKAGSTNRQSSLEEFDPALYGGSIDNLASEMIKDHLNFSETFYKDLIKAGVAKECARMILPLATSTTLYVKGSIRSWIHYLQIRCDEATQLEHREIALAIWDIFSKQFPTISNAAFNETF